MTRRVPHRSTPRLVPVLLLALAAAPVATGAASGPVPPAPVPAGEPVGPEPLPEIRSEGLDEPAPPPVRTLPGSGDTWIDSTHSFLGSVFGTVLRFDRFFADETDLDVERARSFLRWRNELRFGEDTDYTFRTSIRADLRLPGLNRVLRRMRLVVTGETEDTLSTLFPDEDTTAGAVDGARESGRANAELRYGIVDTLRTHLSLGGSVLLDLPPGVRGRVRLRHAFPATG
ncbi:MAG TPA: hypothetical protein VD838_03000, partial [Anaeromyxobacteraceae bacterium]|nr:hypothetical protein [Anaeromyxobacteraceae bacterium]